MGLNGHSARTAIGAHQRRGDKLQNQLDNAMALLAEVANGEWENAEQAADWYVRYQAFAESVDGAGGSTS